jgi:hypothetical protein
MLGEQEDLGFMSVSDLSPLPVACRLMGWECPGCGFLAKTEVQIYTKPAIGT